MQLVRFALALAFTWALIYFLGRPIPIGENMIPPLGAFFSPQQGFWQNAEPANPGYTQSHLALEGIIENVDIYFDQEMVPRIFVQNDLDAAFAQGYVTAYLRLFQMDLSTRSPIGRLSEIIGERTIKHDLTQRRKGLYEAAERLADSWNNDKQTGPLLRAYVAGINARIAQLSAADLPLEYKILDFKPEPWDIVRCAAFYLAMSETLAQTAHDIPLSNAFRTVGSTDFDLLYPDKNPHDIPVIPSATPKENSTSSAFSMNMTMDQHARLWSYDDLTSSSEPGIGSNNWAISSTKTRNGYPILCNDPHLALTLPSIWVEMQLSTPEYQAYGVAFTCLPGIAIGFNQHIAWGFTNAGHDVQDWYAVRWADTNKTRYILDGKEKQAILREEVIHVRGKKEPIRDTIRITDWGPVPNLSEGHIDTDLAMHWLPTLDLNPTMALMFPGLNKARNVEEWRNILLPYDAPMQNAVFASAKGDIALRVSGKLPLRSSDTGRLPYDGSESKFGWSGFVPGIQNPISINPSQGFVASANQQSTDPNYPYYYTGVFEDWRGRYLNEKLLGMDSITVEHMMALQNDNTSLLAREALPVFSALLDSSDLLPMEKMALQSLSSWNHQFDGMNNIPVLFEMWFNQVEQLAWDELFAIKDSFPIEIPEDWRLLELLSTYPELSWWDIKATHDKENASKLVSIAFKKAVIEWGEKNATGDGYWSAYQATGIRHLARIDAFSSRNLDLGGHHSALNAITSTNGPSWRMIVEMGKEIRAFGIYPGGQSGNPGSPFYRNFLNTWSKGAYRTLKIYSTSQDAKEASMISISLNKD
ncbi:MAG: penicillin acylase family protein [Saprospiraceae bacterium]|nr:penicillin acylase family protein [Saprospiraceae bacterium]